jgi:hypothetical protein
MLTIDLLKFWDQALCLKFVLIGLLLCSSFRLCLIIDGFIINFKVSNI